jgi:hypothetical protein
MVYQLSRQKSAIVLNQVSVLALSGNKRGALEVLDATMEIISPDFSHLVLLLLLSVSLDID